MHVQKYKGGTGIGYAFPFQKGETGKKGVWEGCLLYTSDAADEDSPV